MDNGCARPEERKREDRTHPRSRVSHKTVGHDRVTVGPYTYYNTCTRRQFILTEDGPTFVLLFYDE